MQTTQEIGDADEDGTGSRPGLDDRLAWDIAGDELEDIAAAFVDSVVAR